MFPASADVRHDVKVILGTVFRSETAGNLCLGLDVSDIAFRLIVIKQHAEVFCKKAD